ncbi:MAG: hypothetical protein KAI24_25985, partial [Planctomycetes bacterium]|nr:hypothetical protein [Planctomycetota bacterium]
LDASRAEMVRVWERASRHLQALCERHGTRYFHFLQPNQYVPDSKPIGDEERRVAWFDGERSMRPSVEHGYPLLRAAGARLAAAGVPFADLTMMFAARPEPLYVDTCCHLGRRGNELLAERVVATIRRQLDLAGFEAARLEVAPDPLALGSPAEAAQLSVVAVAADGRRLDVAATGLGTRYTSTPADGLLVGDGGAVQAERRGAWQLDVTASGGASARVAVSAQWPDVLVLDDGRAAGDAAPPALRLLGRSAEAQPELQVQGLPEQGFRLLAASARPLPATLRPGQEAFGVATTLLDGAGSAVAARAPAAAPGAGRPLFLRAYVVDAAGELVAASNTLVLTRD